MEAPMPLLLNPMTRIIFDTSMISAILCQSVDVYRETSYSHMRGREL